MSDRDSAVLALAAASKATFPDLAMVACLGIAEAVLVPEATEPSPSWTDQLQLVFTQAVAMGLLPADYRPADFDSAPKPALEVADPNLLTRLQKRR